MMTSEKDQKLFLLSEKDVYLHHGSHWCNLDNWLKSQRDWERDLTEQQNVIQTDFQILRLWDVAGSHFYHVIASDSDVLLLYEVFKKFH